MDQTHGKIYLCQKVRQYDPNGPTSQQHGVSFDTICGEASWGGSDEEESEETGSFSVVTKGGRDSVGATSGKAE
ncbi:hypothetical protein GN244_ATG03541 [Phytophthora infestans]|uniref:Uncharacterized protein n=1 Tax=Phytophthora infestans TaxID=4787 RepID=A0A833SPP1_PHYIN|nr:hypothetical protein GN244_ATG03541 [Phytophthora infestans]KAF4134572.1 hypothetical protein GN958_ATG16235 [Phytophthora infestans]